MGGTTGGTIRIDAADMDYTTLNKQIRSATAGGASEIILDHVLGQRFIADGLRGTVRIIVNGVPGGDLGMFMSGPTCIVHGNADHAPGNTMDGGMIVIHGSAGDAAAHSMRGGKVLVRDDIGYRGGIHMKEYQEKIPVLMVGGNARAYLGEYMAGGLIVVFGLGGGAAVSERGIGSGIHGGEIFIRGQVEDHLLGVGARKLPFGDAERKRIAPFVQEFASFFDMDAKTLMAGDYTRIGPASNRPFANKYTWE
jgi:glutamate synthase domain-containing protein 3